MLQPFAAAHHQAATQTGQLPALGAQQVAAAWGRAWQASAARLQQRVLTRAPGRSRAVREVGGWGGPLRQHSTSVVAPAQLPLNCCLCCCMRPVTCSAVPSGGSATWDAGCADKSPGASCTGTCLSGFAGFPTASCGSDGRWTVSRVCGGCKRCAQLHAICLSLLHASAMLKTNGIAMLPCSRRRCSQRQRGRHGIHRARVAKAHLG